MFCHRDRKLTDKASDYKYQGVGILCVVYHTDHVIRSEPFDLPLLWASVGAEARVTPKSVFTLELPPSSQTPNKQSLCGDSTFFMPQTHWDYNHFPTSLMRANPADCLRFHPVSKARPAAVCPFSGPHIPPTVLFALAFHPLVNRLLTDPDDGSSYFFFPP